MYDSPWAGENSVSYFHLEVFEDQTFTNGVQF